jgi:hypothetical protein
MSSSKVSFSNEKSRDKHGGAHSNVENAHRVTFWTHLLLFHALTEIANKADVLDICTDCTSSGILATKVLQSFEASFFVFVLSVNQ